MSRAHGNICISISPIVDSEETECTTSPGRKRMRTDSDFGTNSKKLHLETLVSYGSDGQKQSRREYVEDHDFVLDTKDLLSLQIIALNSLQEEKKLLVGRIKDLERQLDAVDDAKRAQSEQFLEFIESSVLKRSCRA